MLTRILHNREQRKAKKAKETNWDVIASDPMGVDG